MPELERFILGLKGNATGRKCDKLWEFFTVDYLELILKERQQNRTTTAYNKSVLEPKHHDYLPNYFYFSLEELWAKKKSLLMKFQKKKKKAELQVIKLSPLGYYNITRDVLIFEEKEAWELSRKK